MATSHPESSFACFRCGSTTEPTRLGRRPCPTCSPGGGSGPARPEETGLRVGRVEFTEATPEDRRLGLLGWIACRLNDTLQVDGIMLRRTQDGRLTLSYPAKKDEAGRKHFFLRPLDDRARRMVEQKVFRALGLLDVP